MAIVPAMPVAASEPALLETIVPASFGVPFVSIRAYRQSQPASAIVGLAAPPGKLCASMKPANQWAPSFLIRISRPGTNWLMRW